MKRRDMSNAMQDPFNPGVAIGRIVLTGPAGNRAEIINGDYLPMETADGYLVRATQRRVLGRYNDAISDYDAAIALAPARGDIHFWKAQTYAVIGKKEEAVATFKSAAILFRKAGSEKESAARRWIRRLQQTQ